ncbi:MAG: ABC transporter ATP-binding protein [Thermodesulfobacteriota bacterium]
MNPTPFLSFRGITKSFPAVLANDHIDLDLYGGEIHALLGENGAGKSTLMKILYGFYQADAGEIRVNGQPADIRSPRDARSHRIGMVFQDFVLIPALTVAENIALFLNDLPFVLDRASICKRIEGISERYSLPVDPGAPVWQLSVGERQKVELLKLLLADTRILILDEPTRSLAPHEAAGLFRILGNLRQDGFAITIITHKIREVLECADRITVMRRGRIAGTLPRADATEGDLVALMFGKAVAESPRRQSASPARDSAPLFELRGVSTEPEGTGLGLKAINLTIGSGQIVGVAGVSGNGQRELGDVVLGMERCSQGTKYLDGVDATRWSVARMRGSGTAFIPEDPLGMAAFPWLSVQENMAMADTARYARQGGLSMDWTRVRSDLQASLQRLGFSIPPVYVPLGTLSGGNIQRMILAREMAHDPRLIIAFYPTRGLDVQSAVAAREVLLASRDAGAGILLISEDLDELFALSDRLVVMRRGEIAAEGTPQNLTVRQVGYLMTGSTGEEAKRG